MVKKMSCGLSLTLLLLCLWSTICLAAGSVVDEDFSCKGVMLGDSESVLQAKWGEPLYDKIVIKQGVRVKTYVYKDRSEASIAVRTGKVVDFTVDMEKYTARDNVRKGATKFWLEKVYGKTNKQFIEGEYYLIYTRENHPHQKLLLKVDGDDGHLLNLQISSLPIDEAERAVMAEEGDPILLEHDSDDDNGFAGIDMSNMPQDKEVHLEGWGR
jgi:hypothetical protein